MTQMRRRECKHSLGIGYLKMPQKISTVEFIMLMAVMMALTALAIDSALPAFYAIGETYDVKDPNQLQHIVGAVFLGMTIGQLFYGPLSDSIGRKPALSIGLIIFIIGAMRTAASPWGLSVPQGSMIAAGHWPRAYRWPSIQMRRSLPSPRCLLLGAPSIAAPPKA